MTQIFTPTEEAFLKLIPIHEAEKFREDGMGPILRSLLAIIDQTNAETLNKAMDIFHGNNS
jgi:hypothetical protein